MAFTQVKLTKSINQERGIFDKYIYSSDTDTISDVTTSGYFDESRFIDEWEGSIIERFPRNQDIVEASLVDTAGTPNDFSDDQYLFERFNPRDQSRSSSASLWSIVLGFNYNF